MRYLVPALFALLLASSPASAQQLTTLHAGGAAASAGFPLDLISATSTSAYSTRKLRSAYAGSALRLGRISDSATLDIGFVSNSLDTASAITFCAATTCYVNRWYDQSTSARDINSGNVNQGGELVSSGAVLKTINGHAAPWWQTANASTVGLSTTTMTGLWGQNQNSAFFVAHAVTGAAAALGTVANGLKNLFQSGSNGPFFGIGFAQTVASCAPCMDAWRYTDDWFNGGATLYQFSNAYTFDTDAIFAARWNTADGTPNKAYLNGTTAAVAGATTTVAGKQNGASLTIAGGGSPGVFDGWIGEAIFFNTEISISDANTLGGNMATYWGLSWSTISQ